MANLFDALCSCLQLDSCRDRFLEAEGVDLMILLLRNKCMSRFGALKVLSHVLSGHQKHYCCALFVEHLGLRVRRQRGKKEKKKRKKKKEREKGKKKEGERETACGDAWNERGAYFMFAFSSNCSLILVLVSFFVIVVVAEPVSVVHEDAEQQDVPQAL